jgi:predicted DCC family thiol-disulfide oxidoreductase YuxK
MMLGQRVRPGQLVVLHDGICGLCAQLHQAIAAIDVLRRVGWLPLQTPGLLDLVGIPAGAALEAVWAITADGERVRGGETVAHVLDSLVPAPLPVFARLRQVEAVRRVVGPLFHRVSEQRRALWACPADAGLRTFKPLSWREEAELRSRLGARAGAALQS